MITLVGVIRVIGIGVIVSNTRACAFSKRKMCNNVFVYGTLKRNQPNHHWLTKPRNGKSKFVSDGTTKTKYPLVVATKFNIPFLLQKPGSGHNVKGEIYEVDEEMLANLDVLEEHPNFYIREIDNIVVNGRETVKCWVYFQKKFRPELLDLQMVEDYSSTGAHGLVYVPVPEQDPTYNYKPQIRSTSQCWVYFLKHYNPKLLKMPMISDYTSAGNHYSESDVLNAATMNWDDVVRKN